MALTDEKARQARLDARREIVQAANRHIVVSRARCPFNPGPEIMAPFTMRHIQRAVHVARQHQLVKPHVLELAGYTRKARP